MLHIGPTLSITGDIDCESHDLVIDGYVRGRVRVRNVALTIGTQGRVDGDIRGVRVAICGEVKGSIWASERIELATTARVDGTLSANTVVVADGAVLNGRVDMDQRTIAARVARYKAEHAGATA